MSSPGIKRGGLVHLIERRGEQLVQHNALVLAMSMDTRSRGSHGEMSIDAVFVNPLRPLEGEVLTDPRDALMLIENVVHISHRDWIEQRVCVAYEQISATRFLSGGELMMQLNSKTNGGDAHANYADEGDGSE
jgi:hypothetical protein